MFVLVVGGGKVGYYLAKELIESGHEIALMEKDRTRARQIADEIGSIVIAHDGCEGKYLAEAGCMHDPSTTAICAPQRGPPPNPWCRMSPPSRNRAFRPKPSGRCGPPSGGRRRTAAMPASPSVIRRATLTP